MRGSVPRLPACPDLMPVIAASMRVGVRVTRRNRQDFDRRYTGLRSLQYFVDEKIVKFGHVLTIGALYFDLAAKMVVAWQWVGPDHAEMMFAIRTHERIVAWHSNSCIRFFAGRRRGEHSLLFLVPRVHEQLYRSQGHRSREIGSDSYLSSCTQSRTQVQITLGHRPEVY
jgi:hypothetical protein